MQSDEKKLLEFIFDPKRVEAPACQACQDALYAYVDAELDGEGTAAQFPTVKAHLDECLLCQQEYKEMKALLLMERQETLSTPPVEVEFDFSYLPPTSEEDSLWKRVSQRVTHLSSEVRIFVREGRAIFDELPLRLAPTWVATPALRLRSTEKQVPLVTLPDTEQNIKISVLAVGVGSDQMVSLIVRVESLEPSFLVSRAKVSLTDRQAVMLQGAYTGADGEVEFSDVGRGDYLVIVKHKKREWKIPVYFGG